MLKRIAGSVAALTLAVAGVGLVGSAAQAQGAGATVTAADIPRVETLENYTTWHQGATPGGRYASTTDGLLVEGTTQIIKGETVLPSASELLAYAQSSTIVATGGPVWHQIGFGIDDGSWTTVRALAGAESGNWITSQPINGVAKNTAAPLETLLDGLTGNLTYLSGGFYVDKKAPVLVSSYSVNGVTTSFDLAAIGTQPTQVKTVLSADIRPNEDTYLGWHDGAAVGGTYESTLDGLTVTGKAQILNGENASSTQVAQFVTGLALEASGDDVWYQVPVQSEAGFTTLRATQAMADSGTWVTSRQVGTLAANARANINDIALSLGNHTVIGYGFYLDAGKTATVKSITANGTQTFFNSEAPLPAGAGKGLGADVAPPAAIGSITLERGGALPLHAPSGIFTPGEDVTVTMYSEPIELGSFVAAETTGAVTGEAVIPENAPAGTHRVLFQGADTYYWAPEAFVLESGPGNGNGNGNGNNGGEGTITPNDPTKVSDGSSQAGGAKGQQLAVSGSAQNLLPVLMGGVALMLGTGLVMMRRRLNS